MGAENRGSVFCRGAEADPSVVFYGPGNRRIGAQRSLRSRFPVASLLRPGEFGDDIRKPHGLSTAVLESTLVSFCVSGRSVFGLPSGRAGRACSRRAVGCFGPIVCRFLFCGVVSVNLAVCQLPCWNRLWFRSVCRGDPFSDYPQAGRAARARAEQLAVSALLRDVSSLSLCMSLIRGCRTGA